MDQLDRLRSIPLLAGLDEASLGRVADVATEFSVSADHVLIEQGHPASGLFLLETGRVAIELPGGRVLENGPGEVFGELGVLTDRPRAARVRTLTEASGLAIRRRDLERLLDSEPRLAVALLRHVAGLIGEDGR
jgi:monovalent cation:H+ antiporter, CPA1 family